MYLSPPNMDDYGISLPGGVKPEPNVNAALRVLTIQPDLIYTFKVTAIICLFICLSDIMSCTVVHVLVANATI